MHKVLVGCLAALLLPGCAESAAPAAQDVAMAAAGGAGTSLRVEQVVREGLKFPTAIASPRDGSGRMFVLERDGRIRILGADGALLPDAYYTRLVNTDDIEQGLLGLTFDPDFKTNGRLYVAYSGTPDEGWGMVLRRLQAKDPAANAFDGADDVLMRVGNLASNHNGGDLHFGPDGMLYWSVGAGTGQPEDHAHAKATDTLLGKILRIDVRDGASGAKNRCGETGRADYAIPADNPFAGQRGQCGEIWVHGLRNPWRFSIDQGNGDLWIGDVGKDREEITRFRAAQDKRDLGFPQCQGSHAYPSTGTTDCPEKTGTTGPVYEYAGGYEDRCAITGGFVYRGPNASLKGAYVFADSCSSEILVGRMGDDGKLKVESIDGGVKPGYGTVASFGEDEDNGLWFINHENGGVYRLK